MGSAQSERIRVADKEFGGRNGNIELVGDMELVDVQDGYMLIVIVQNAECNCIEIFRPEPPMIIGGADMSLWWSYHPLTQHEINKLTLLKDRYPESKSGKEAASYPIREISVNGIRHSL